MKYEDKRCIFRDELNDMGALIVFCLFDDSVYPKHCNDKCKHYISRAEVIKEMAERVKDK